MFNKLNGEETIKHRRALLKITISLTALVFGGSNAFADSNAIDEVTVTVPVSCSITGTVGSAHTTLVDIGTYEDEIGETSFNVLCNDANGFAVYAVGYSNNLYGNTSMVPSTLAAVNGIATGTATSGDISNWAMKLTAVSGTYSPTLGTGFNTYHAVPNEYTKVASLTSNTDAVSGSSFKSTYAVYVSGAQPADTYTGKVKYTVVHPANADAPEGITDLTGTTWEFKDLVCFYGSTASYANNCSVDYTFNDNSTYVFNVNYTSNSENFSSFEISQRTGKTVLNIRYDNDYAYEINVFRWNQGNPNYKIVTFTGGTDATNLDFIKWVRASATQLYY